MKLYLLTGPNAMINTLPPQGMPPYGSQSQQFPQGNYPARPQYPANYGQGENLIN